MLQKAAIKLYKSHYLQNEESEVPKVHEFSQSNEQQYKYLAFGSSFQLRNDDEKIHNIICNFLKIFWILFSQIAVI